MADDWGESETTSSNTTSAEKPNFGGNKGRGRGYNLKKAGADDGWATDATDNAKVSKANDSAMDEWGSDQTANAKPKAANNANDEWNDDWGGGTTNTSSNNDNRYNNRGGGGGGGGGGPRSCFNCGETGHNSRDCSQPRKEREPMKCFNCQGTGHRSSDCTEPRKERQPMKCYNCQGEGHRSSDCTEPKKERSGPRKCFNCDQEGHSSRDCTEPKKERTGPRSCYNCGETGHMSNNCPNPKKEGGRRGGASNRNGFSNDGNSNSADAWDFGGSSATAGGDKAEEDTDWGTGDSKPSGAKDSGSGCRKCGKEGHFARECPDSEGGNRGPLTCRRCNKEGHKAIDCTEEVLGEDGKPKPPPYKPALINEDDENLYETVPQGINFERYDKIKVSISGENAPKPIAQFGDAITSELINTAIGRCKYDKPTPVQKYAIPIIMGKRDLMACAQTGSGKTGAFVLPILQELLKMSDLPSMYGQATQEPLCVVISPTRELSIQIHTEAVKFAKGSIIKPALIYGGTSSGYQMANISRGAHFLVATPGRLLDFVDKGKISFSQLKYLILDEADRMIDQGFLPEVRRMVSHESMPSKENRQTLMFSATFPDEVQRMAREFLKDDYLFLTVGIVGAANSDVEQTFIEVDGKQKRSKLMDILNNCESTDRTLVFVEKKKTADFLASFLSQNNMKSTSIHGDRYQSQRETALYDFRSGRMPILVATSVAARGLDIKDVKHVINYDLPKEIDEYVHRIGRTGRVGNIGKATSFYDPYNDNDIGLAKNLIKILSDADQSVPDFLQNGGSGKSGGFESQSFGGTDIRKDTTAVTNDNDEWD